MLHRVLPERPTAFGRPSCYRLRGTALTPEELERLLDVGSFRTLDEVTGALAAGESPPPGHVLTFDDGYREWLELIAPRFEERRIPAAFFVCPAFLREAPEAHPVDVFYWLLDHARLPRFELRLPDGTVTHGTLETDEGKQSLVTGDLKRFVVTGPPEEVREVLSRLAEALHLEIPGDLPWRLYPSERELAGLVAAGHRLGGHGVRHRHLTTLDGAEASSEISTSLAWVARLSEGRSVPFAYPDGAFDEETARRVQQAGATCALTCVPGPVTRESGLFQLPREFVTPTHPLVTGARSPREDAA
jgi:peptidoglycan/xylan/chitin deacetylase (PgdA/CDA1 family)